MLEIKVASDNIRFPDRTEGLADISQLLSAQFARQYENVYIFCLSDSVNADEGTLCCRWLVVMSGKEDGDIRVGYGTYEWSFNHNYVTHLIISIDEMVLLEQHHSTDIFLWVDALSYPWCHSAEIFQNMPQSLGFLKTNVVVIPWVSLYK